MANRSVIISSFVGLGLLSLPLLSYADSWHVVTEHEDDTGTSIRLSEVADPHPDGGYYMPDPIPFCEAYIQGRAEFWKDSLEGYDWNDEVSVRYQLTDCYLRDGYSPGDQTTRAHAYYRFSGIIEAYQCPGDSPLLLQYSSVGSCEEDEDDTPQECTSRDPYDGTLSPVWFNDNMGQYEANYDDCAWFADSSVVTCFNSQEGLVCSALWMPFADEIESPPDPIQCDEDWGECSDNGGDDGGSGGNGGDDGGSGGNGGDDGGSGGNGGDDGGSGGGGDSGTGELDYGRLQAMFDRHQDGVVSGVEDGVRAGIRESMTEQSSSNPNYYIDNEGLSDATGSATSAWDGIVSRVSNFINDDPDAGDYVVDESYTDLFTNSEGIAPSFPEPSCSNVVFAQGEPYEFELDCEKIEIFRRIFGWILWFWTFVTVYDLFTSALRPRVQG